MERDPQEIYYFLFTNNIGKKDPALYEEWAFALETRKDYKQAHDLLFDGMFQCRNNTTAYQRLYANREALPACSSTSSESSAKRASNSCRASCL
mmetsp:Transcript_1953/g.2316  ORF Transcript_1953/g.2316 Transcript_1953/m.2316 type:complete len:94 (-) Transcript_1953:116-397(-)